MRHCNLINNLSKLPIIYPQFYPCLGSLSHNMKFLIATYVTVSQFGSTILRVPPVRRISRVSPNIHKRVPIISFHDLKFNDSCIIIHRSPICLPMTVTLAKDFSLNRVLFSRHSIFRDREWKVAQTTRRTPKTVAMRLNARSCKSVTVYSWILGASSCWIVLERLWNDH